MPILIERYPLHPIQTIRPVDPDPDLERQADEAFTDLRSAHVTIQRSVDMIRSVLNRLRNPSNWEVPQMADLIVDLSDTMATLRAECPVD
jgi:hypothetical protein